jgi:N-formylglutamate deformylase
MPKILPFQLLSRCETIAPLPVLVDSPHSGSFYPEDFRFSVGREDLSILEDKHIDLIFSGAVALGANVLNACVARSYVDCNQDACQIDPVMFDIPNCINAEKLEQKPIRGPFQRVLPDDQNVYSRQLSLREAKMRLENVYFPYRFELKRLVLELLESFPVISHLSCHAASQESGAIDVCFSNDQGETSSNELVSVLIDVVRSFGLTARSIKNARTGSIVRDIGDPLLGVHSVEVYLRRGLYCQGKSQNISGGLNNCQKLANALIVAAAEFSRSCCRSESAF